MVERVDHLVVVVSDLEAATRTYQALLGCRPSWRGEHPGAGTANALFRLDNTYVELLAPCGEGPVGAFVRNRLAREGEGPGAIALGTRDVAACAEQMRARGLIVPEPSENEGRERGGACRRWRSTIVDPSATRGVVILLIEHLSPQQALPRATPTGGPEGAVEAVDHVVIMTGDATGAVRLYRDRLGIRLALDKTLEKPPVRLLFFRLGGVTIECAVPEAARERLGDRDRFWGISYRVAEIGSAHARLTASGFDVSEVRAGLRPGTRVLSVRGGTHGVATLFVSAAS